MYTKFFNCTLSSFYVYEFRSFCILKFIYVYTKFICASAFRVTRIVQHADSHADVFVVNYVVGSTFDAAQKFGLFGFAFFLQKVGLIYLLVYKCKFTYPRILKLYK